MEQDSTARIISDLRSWIADAPVGAQLPPSRVIASRHGASPVTVQKAMRQLVTLGLVESRPGVGSFVRGVRTNRPADYGWQTAVLGIAADGGAVSATQRPVAPDAIALHSGYPARALLPDRLVRQALTRAARAPGAILASPAAGMPDLQAWFARELGTSAPAGVAAPGSRDAIVIAGSQSGLASTFRAVATDGRPLLVESPTYWGAILAARQAGVPLIPVPSGPHGPDPDEIDRALVRTGARAFYAQPTFANPTGAVWPAGTRERIVEIMRDHGAFLIEDDWARDLAIDAPPAPVAASDDSGHVIYLRSLTKSVSPAIRVAAVIARGPVRDRILAGRAAESLYVSGVLQSAALNVVTQPAWRTHLRGVRDELRARRDLLLASLAEHAPSAHVGSVPTGGLNLWVQLPEGTDVTRVVQACASDGLIIAAGHEWFPAEPAGAFVRLNYSGEHPERFSEAARILEANVARGT